MMQDYILKLLQSKLYLIRTYRFRIKFIAAMVIAALLQLGIILILISFNNETSYYASNSESMLIPLQALDAPNNSDTALLNDEAKPYTTEKTLVL